MANTDWLKGINTKIQQFGKQHRVDALHVESNMLYVIKSSLVV